MAIVRRGAFGWVAALAGVLVLGCAAVVAQDRFRWEPPPVPDCTKLPGTCKALERAVQANDELRAAYLSDVGACREGACKPKVKPFDAGTDAGTLGPLLKLSLEVCLARCDRSYPDKGPRWDECRQACYGTK